MTGFDLIEIGLILAIIAGLVFLVTYISENADFGEYGHNSAREDLWDRWAEDTDLRRES